MFAPIIVALVLSLVMLGAWRLSGRRAAAVVALLWLAYAAYEFQMYRRVWCSGECNIRIDLLLIYPLLIGASLYGGIGAAIARLRSRRR